MKFLSRFFKPKVKPKPKCKHEWKQIETNIEDLYVICECVKCKEKMTVGI